MLRSTEPFCADNGKKLADQQTSGSSHPYTCAYVPTVAVSCRGGTPGKVKEVIEKGEPDIKGHAEGV